jgi:hypothetical protein
VQTADKDKIFFSELGLGEVGNRKAGNTHMVMKFVHVSQAA